MTTDNFGDRMKAYEVAETGRRFMPLLPVYARIDGRGFSRFTKGMDRPYDLRMSCSMVETTKHLVDKTHARIGYTQSDEISLVWLTESYDGDMFFAGKIQKMVSVLAGMATAKFGRIVGAWSDQHYADRLPHFDCRVFQLPNETEAANAILWREQDAFKNAVSMAARHYYGPAQLHGHGRADMMEMLFQKGVNFNDYPAFFKRGTFVRRVVEQRSLTSEELARIPESKRPSPGMTFTRQRVAELDMPIFSKVTNRVDVVFRGAEPVVAES